MKCWGCVSFYRVVHSVIKVKRHFLRWYHCLWFHSNFIEGEESEKGKGVVCMGCGWVFMCTQACFSVTYICTFILTILIWKLIVLGWFDTQTCRHHKSKQWINQKWASRCCSTCHFRKYQNASVPCGYTCWQWHARLAKVGEQCYILYSTFIQQLEKYEMKCLGSS